MSHTATSFYEIKNAVQQLNKAAAADEMLSMQELKDLVERYRGEIRDLKENNSEMVQELQQYKSTVAAKEKERCEVLKENAELRMKLIRLRTGSAALDKKLKSELKEIDDQIVGHLVQVPGLYARGIQLREQYLLDRSSLETEVPAWVATGTGAERVRRVPPLLIGGQSIQPVVALSRTILSNTTRTENSITEPRAAVHMLPDAYIPLQRISIPDLGSSLETDGEAQEEAENSAADLQQDELVQENDDQEEIQQYDESLSLEVVMEEDEEANPTPSRSMRGVDASNADNPLEGPSWLLDEPGGTSGQQPEADSTTGCHWPQGDDNAEPSPPLPPSPILRSGGRVRPAPRAAPPAPAPAPARSPPACSPTRRRRLKRVCATPTPTPPRRDSVLINESRELRVVITDFALSESGCGSAQSKRSRRVSIDCSSRIPMPSLTPRGAAPYSRPSARRSLSLARSPSPSPLPLPRRMHSPTASDRSFEGFPTPLRTDTSPKQTQHPACIPDEKVKEKSSPEAGGSGSAFIPNEKVKKEKRSPEAGGSRERHTARQRRGSSSRGNSHGQATGASGCHDNEHSDSDASSVSDQGVTAGTRQRRQRKPVVYKEVPLNSRKTSTAGQRPPPRFSTTIGPAPPASKRLPRPSTGRRSTEWEACLHYVFQCVVATRELYCPNGHLFYELCLID